MRPCYAPIIKRTAIRFYGLRIPSSRHKENHHSVNGAFAMRTKDEKLHERRKAEILSAAATCFAEKGIRQTTMQEICARARISPGALYRYFESKDDIIAMLAEAERRANDELISYLTSKQDITRALRDALPDIVKKMTKPPVARLTLEITAEAARNRALSVMFLEGENAFKSQLASLLDAGKAGGYVEETLDTAAFVHLFVNLLDSLSVSYAFPVKATRKSLVRGLDHILYRSLTPQSRLK